jgi:methylated-DNA-[protein]-cysteine S-methyltransferase
MSRAGFTVFDTSLGACAVAWGEAGLRRVWLPETDGNAEALRRRIARENAVLVERAPPAPLRAVVRRIAAATAGERVRFDDLAVDYGAATDFQRAVYDALKDTAPGETLSYGELAARAGRPGAARAVGRAMATNPLPIVVPCHRVLGAGGAIGGFSSPGGTRTKAQLLAREGVIVEKGRPLPYDRDEAVRALRRDRALGALMDRVGPFSMALQPRTSTFASLARAIVYRVDGPSGPKTSPRPPTRNSAPPGFRDRSSPRSAISPRARSRATCRAVPRSSA